MNIYKAIIADDEEWAIKDLLAIIDWKKQGFEIVKTTTNSNEVLEILKNAANIEIYETNEKVYISVKPLE